MESLNLTSVHGIQDPLPDNLGGLVLVSHSYWLRCYRCPLMQIIILLISRMSLPTKPSMIGWLTLKTQSTVQIYGENVKLSFDTW